MIEWIAYRLPRRLVRWCFIRVATAAKGGGAYDGNAGERLCMDALADWDGEYRDDL